MTGAFAPPRTDFDPSISSSTKKISSRPFSTTPKLFLKSLQELEDQYLGLAIQNNSRPEIVYILMYNPGTDQEGVHTTEYPKDGSGSEVVLGFEEIADCVDFSTALKQNPNFPLEPIPTPAPFDQMQAAVQGMGLNILIVPPVQQ